MLFIGNSTIPIHLTLGRECQFLLQQIQCVKAEQLRGTSSLLVRATYNDIGVQHTGFSQQVFAQQDSEKILRNGTNISTWDNLPA